MELTDLIRALIPVLPVVIISLAASAIPRFISTKPPVFELKKEVDIICLLVAVFLIWGSITSGPRVLVAPMFWVIIAIFSILFLYIHKSFSDMYVRIDSQGITTRKFYGRMKNVPYTDISEYIFKPHSDKLIIKDFRGRKTLIRPLKTSTQLSLFHLAFRMTEGRWAQPHSTDDRRKLEESIETNSGVQYLLDHPHGKL